MWGQRYGVSKVILFSRPAICNLVCMLLARLRSVFIATGAYLVFHAQSFILDFNLITLNSVEYNFIIVIDFTALVFIGTVTLIAGCVVYYRKDYISGDPLIHRFIWTVFIFVISIIALILRPNLIRILLGWDGLGLVSYALVIYYQNIKSFNAGIVTALSNRIGDVIILISIALASSIGRFNFMHTYSFDHPVWQGITIIITVAACTKRAQIPFSAWLPAAIAAPTPVSALVHSSTLVTAGVYLLIRFHSPMQSLGLGTPLTMVAILTILIAGIGANYETDLKKIVALSTLRQLGLIILSIGIGAIKLAYFHILRHALFKALLFMCAGNVIHCMGDTQDLRKMGGITILIPITSVCLNTANLALCGAPFMAGFYSKDLILETILSLSYPHIVIILSIAATALTVSYSLRLSYFSMVHGISGRPLINFSDSTIYSCSAMLPLATLSILGGLVISWVILPNPTFLILPAQAKTMIIPILVLGAIFRVSLWAHRSSISPMTNNLTQNCMMGSIWFIPSLVTRGYTKSALTLGYNYTSTLDRGWVEILSITWFTKSVVYRARSIQTHQNNFLKTFILTFLVWFILALFVSLCINSLN